MTLEPLFETFAARLQEALPQHLAGVLQAAPNETIYAIAFVTTDDFYGMYTAYATEEALAKLDENQQKFFGYYKWAPNEWKGSANGPSEVFYDLLVKTADDAPVNLMQPSAEKWQYATAFMDTLGKALATVPDEVFAKAGYSRDNLVFYTTMSDGDYMAEMTQYSAKQYNRPSPAVEELLQNA